MNYNRAVGGLYAGSLSLIVNGDNVVSNGTIIAATHGIAHFELLGHEESVSRVWTYCQSCGTRLHHYPKVADGSVRLCDVVT
jgi:hypothetical protein